MLKFFQCSAIPLLLRTFRLLLRNKRKNLRRVHFMVKSKRDGMSAVYDVSNPTNMADHEREIVLQFVSLLEKSKRSFHQLRGVPQNGIREWQTYFCRTFDIYTKLWKFQQQHRRILDSKFGLKRWQIGEIASKIGQLYYNYYLRTSDTSYLTEAFSFYSAIRGRSYYSPLTKQDKTDLITKKLRYYARFIVVALLLRKMQLVQELIVELETLVMDYTSTYDPEDQLEWAIVCDEIKALLKTDSVVTVFLPDSTPIVLSHRLTPLTTPPVERMPHMNLILGEAVVVGNVHDQVKFNEITVDMYRMLQTLEREIEENPLDVSADKSSTMSGNFSTKAVNGPRPARRKNPHKHLLYKPTVESILDKLATGCLEMSGNGTILFYVSADGYYPPSKTTIHSEFLPGYESGLICYTGKEHLDASAKKSSYHFPNCLYPGDLGFMLRRPTFIIIDSDNSYAFEQMTSPFGMPLVVMMSPRDAPPAFQEHRNEGNLFTLFLNSPLTAFCLITKLFKVPTHHWERCQSFIDRFVTEGSRLITRCNKIEPSYISFFGDDFLRVLILRYVFCHVVLSYHRSYKVRHYRPRITPPLPEAELLEHPSLVNLVLDLASHLEVRSHFFEPHELQ